MSDDEKARRSGEEFTSIPPELRGYIDKDERPYIQRRGENPELDAAFAELLEPLPEEPQKIDLARGAGNQSAYVAPVPLPVNENKPAGGGKVELAVADVPRQLPLGEREQKTEQVRTIGLRDRTDAPMEVPPSGASTSTSTSAHTQRRLVVGAVIVISVAALVGVLAMKNGAAVVVPADAATALTAATVAPEVPATMSAAAPAPPVPSAPHEVESAVPPASGSAKVPVAPPAPAPEASQKQGGHAAAPRPSVDDPYRDAAVAPPKATATPRLQPTSSPATAAPAAPPPPAAA